MPFLCFSNITLVLFYVMLVLFCCILLLVGVILVRFYAVLVLCCVILMLFCVNLFYFIPLNSFSYRGSGGVAHTGFGPMMTKFLKTADNFCAQARYLVHVTFATLRRNRSVASLLQKNT